MAIFPALEPTTREYTFGVFPLTEEPSASAGIIRFRHAAIPASYQLTLGYSYLSEAAANLIRTHYGTQAGGFISFTLPSTVWKGHTFSANIAPLGMLWRYAEPPEETHEQLGRYSMSVFLESDGQMELYPPDLVATIAAGSATGA